jgi:hypothetical protein
MIGKISSQPAGTEYVQLERSIKEPVPQIKEDPVYERPSRESSEQTANARKNEMAITGATQKAFLDSQIQLPVKQTAVAAKQPEPIADSSSTQTFKRGDKGPEVSRLIYDVQTWQKQNGLPMTPGPEDGSYTEDIERAVRQFQIANNMYATGKVDSNTRNRLTLETDPNFRFLDNEVKQSVRSTMDIYADQPAAQKNILDLATDKQFAHLLSKDSQTSALNGLLMHPQDKDHLKNVKDAVVDVAILEKEKTLDKLPESTKRQVINTLFKKTEDEPAPGLFIFRGSEARKVLIDLAKSPQFSDLSEPQQRKMLDAIAANPSSNTAAHMQEIISSNAFKAMDPKMKERVIDLTCENAQYPLVSGAKYANEFTDRLYNLSQLIQSKKFENSSEDDKYAQLNAFKTPLSNQNKEIDIL